MPEWRYLEDDDVEAPFGLATDELLLTGSTGTGAPPATLRLYWYRSHCALVGRFQNLAAEVDLAACRSLGVSVNRRPTGGGAILMGDAQLGVALLTTVREAGGRTDVGELCGWFSRGLVEGLRELGVEAEFHPRNDILVRGRKIAGTGLCADGHGGLLFHASVLADLDIPLMLRVLRIPVQKIADKPIAAIEDRTTTVTRELGRPHLARDLRPTVRRVWAETLGVTLDSRPLSDEERNGIARLLAEKYSTPAWLFERTPPGRGSSGSPPSGLLEAEAASALLPPPEGVHPSEGMGESLLRTSGGMLRVYLAVSRGTVKSAWITGDFFATTPAVASLESSLKWRPVVRQELLAAVEAEYRRSGGIAGVREEELTNAVFEAGERAEAGT